MADKPLRFAALIRVSTEKQEKQGESLRTQEKQITAAVKSLGGEITKRYAGQEHATAGQERKQLDMLLDDASKSRKPFDAVIVADASRWSRDNERSKAGLRTLKENGIRFFSLTQEYDLYDPNATFFLGMSAEIGEYQARQQKMKSVNSCIDRAKRTGAPTAGRPPFGRIWNKKTKSWSIDKKKQAIIEDIANRYLAGERLPVLAKEYGINHAFLNTTLAKKCGNSYTITWDIEDLNIHETVTIKIPRLLPDRTIKAIRKKAEANRTYQHGQPKYQYLLSGYVFCGECGYAMFGQTNHQTTQYHRHSRLERARECSLDPRPWVRADQLEKAVIEMLFDAFSNPKGMERAIERAVPNHKKIEESRSRISELEGGLAKVARARKRILGLIKNNLITNKHAKPELQELNEREAVLQEEIERLTAFINDAPTPKSVKDAAEKVVSRFSRSMMVNARLVAEQSRAMCLEKMTWDEKRALVEEVFNGHCSDGRPMGVYIEPIEGQADRQQKQWRFTIRGVAPADEIKCVTRLSSGCTAPALR